MDNNKVKAAFKNPEFDYIGPDINSDIVVRWSAKDIGFGEFSFYIKDRKLMCDNECMSKEFVRKALMALVDEAEFKDS